MANQVHPESSHKEYKRDNNKAKSVHLGFKTNRNSKTRYMEFNKRKMQGYANYLKN